MRLLLRSASLLALAASALAAHAQAVLGPSDLLGRADAATLSDWYGRSLLLGRIYARPDVSNGPSGMESIAFHDAVDGKGPTFSVFEATVLDGDLAGQTFLVGGYNSLSWESSYADYAHFTYGDHTAFIFNLTTGRLQRSTPGPAGDFQAQNGKYFGPYFGPVDLAVNDSALSAGFAQTESYSDGSGRNIFFDTNYNTNFAVGHLEVFTFTPVPGPAAALPFALLALKRRKRA